MNRGTREPHSPGLVFHSLSLHLSCAVSLPSASLTFGGGGGVGCVDRRQEDTERDGGFKR